MNSPLTQMNSYKLAFGFQGLVFWGESKKGIRALVWSPKGSLKVLSLPLCTEFTLTRVGGVPARANSFADGASTTITLSKVKDLGLVKYGSFSKFEKMSKNSKHENICYLW